MESKIKIKVGSLELEFEGTEEYLKEELPNLIELILGYSIPDEINDEEEEGEILEESKDPAKKKLQATTNTIATKLNVKTGSDLVIATCAHLALVKGADTFTRKNILAEMKEASNFFKVSYRQNLSSILSRLIKNDKLIERSKDTYALNSNTLKELESKLLEK